METEEEGRKQGRNKHGRTEIMMEQVRTEGRKGSRWMDGRMDGWMDGWTDGLKGE